MKEFIVSHNGIVYYSKVGELNVVKEMSELGAEAGGEGSRGVCAPQALLCRNSHVQVDAVSRRSYLTRITRS